MFYLNLGSLLEMKDAENALRAFEQATRLSPEDPIVLLNSATCLLNCGIRNKAQELVSRYRDLCDSGKVTGISKEVSG